MDQCLWFMVMFKCVNMIIKLHYWWELFRCTESVCFVMHLMINELSVQCTAVKESSPVVHYTCSVSVQSLNQLFDLEFLQWDAGLLVWSYIKCQKYYAIWCSALLTLTLCLDSSARSFPHVRITVLWWLKGYSTPKWKFCRFSLTPMSFRTRKSFVSLQNTI